MVFHFAIGCQTRRLQAAGGTQAESRKSCSNERIGGDGHREIILTDQHYGRRKYLLACILPVAIGIEVEPPVEQSAVATDGDIDTAC